MYFSYGRGFQKEEFAKSEIPPMVMMGGDVSFIYTLYGTLLPVYEVNKSI